MQKLEIIRGTTQFIYVSVTNDDGTVYQFQTGDVLKLGVKRNLMDNDDEIILYKEAQLCEDGQAVFSIEPEDTLEIEPSFYYFDVGLQDENGAFYIIIPCGHCVILPAVTQKE